MNVLSQNFTIKTPAKINRTLYITGYDAVKNLHTLDSEFCALSLADELSVTKTEDRKIKLSISGPFAKGVPNNEHNTMYKVAKAFFEKHGFSFGLHIHCVKNIPHEAGLGGGSSNAAGVLRALEHFSGISPSLPVSTLQSLGNDILFFYGESPCARCTGFGEIVSPSLLSPPPTYGVLLFTPRISVSTPWAYQQFRQKSHLKGEDGYPCLQEKSQIKNDFEPVIFSHFPDLLEWKNALFAFGAKEAGLTGSGSGIFGLFSDSVLRDSALLHFSEGVPFEILKKWPSHEKYS